MSCAAYLNEAVLVPLGMDASLGLAPAEAPRTARVWQAGRYGEDELFNSERFRRDGPPQGGGFATARGYGKLLSCLLAGGAADGGALLAQETVDEMLAPQFGPLPGGVNGVGEWPNLCWGLGFDVRGEREPHWAGAALSPARRESLRRIRHARLARSGARPGPRGARKPRQLQRVVARAVGSTRRRCDGGGRSGVDPAMKRIRTRPGAGPEAFDDLVEAHLGDVHRYLVYLTGDRTLADDLTADAFERAWKQRDRFDPRRAGPRSWLLDDRPLVCARPSARRAPPRSARAARGDP